jgi:hypothetical protein
MTLPDHIAEAITKFFADRKHVTVNEMNAVLLSIVCMSSEGGLWPPPLQHLKA